MQVVIVYKEQSDHAREVYEWIDQFKHRSQLEIREIDPETKEGETFITA